MKNRRYPDPRPIAVDLFCGAGGMSLGFEQAGFSIALGVDADGHHVAAHKRNFPYGHAVCASVVGLSGERIRALAKLDGEIDLVFGGPPCQGFSSMGHRDKDDPRNTLVDEFARIVLELRPRTFVMENVPAMDAGATRAILDRIITDLEAGGYLITKPIRKLLASDFGVPQLRTRLFVIGIRSDVGKPIAYPKGAAKGQPPRPTVFEAIADLPSIERYEELFTDDYVRYDQPPMTHYARVARGFEDDSTDLSIPRMWDRTVCSGCMRTRHSPSSTELYAATPPGAFVPGHKLPRLDPHGLAPTLRAGSDSTRGSYTAPRPIHPYVPRCITTREAARLHGYPDWFAFFPTKWHAYKQVGNSVVPPIARAIGRQLLKALRVRYTKAAPSAIAVGRDFELPDDRPRQHRRIPQVREYPPVVAELFRQRFEPASGRLRNRRFTFEDVKKAIAFVGAKLHWTRAETFLDEIARSRNVKRILAKPLAHNFSILPLTDSDGIGEFVPLGTPGTIEHKDELGAKAKDLLTAVQLESSADLLRDIRSNVQAFLNDSDVRSRLWRKTIERIDAEPDLLPFAPTNVRRLRLLRSSGRGCDAYVVVAAGNNVPTRARVQRVARACSATEILTLTPVTAKHVLVSRFDVRNGRPVELKRLVFALNGQHASADSRAQTTAE